MKFRSILTAALPLATACLYFDAMAQDGAAIFEAQCAACHADPVDATVPPVEQLRRLDANGIVRSLTEGNMRLQGQTLSQAQRESVAVFLSGQPLRPSPGLAAGGLCTQPAGRLVPGGPQEWNGWGPTVTNTRYQPADENGLTAETVDQLELKWAFAVPNATQSRSQPAVVGGRIYIASDVGLVYALDAETGCTYWTFEADASVRTAISVGPTQTGHAVYFADGEARAYAVDADTGSRLWTRKVDNEPVARVTGSPTLHDGVLYVPTSGVSEETAASMPDYECCTFRGAITALDAETGDLVWKTYTMPQPQRRGTSTTGKPLWGPAGAAIWSAPTVDAERGVVYAATGNAYADPTEETSNAVIAFDIATGRMRWVNQLQEGDVWIMGCDGPPAFGGGAPGQGGPGRGGPGRGGFGPPGGGNGRAGGPNPNCPESVGPDYDFSASPALTQLDNGRDVIVITQKSGLGYALDPDSGDTLWTYRWGQGSPVGGVWGVATDGEYVYFPVADQLTPAPGGIHAVDIATGEAVWQVGPQPPLCGSGNGCSAAQSAAATAIPGAVFSGSADGGMRAYASGDGEILWTFDTNRDYETVNGVAGRGGSMDGPGPVVSGNRLYVTSGNGGIVGTPGNVLLVFEVAD